MQGSPQSNDQDPASPRKKDPHHEEKNGDLGKGSTQEND